MSAIGGRPAPEKRQLYLVHAMPLTAVAGAPTVPAERLFRMLDGRTLTLAGTRWIVNVYSIRGDGRSRWVQIAVVGPQRHTLTLRLTLTDDGTRALEVVASWLSRPLVESEEILTVS